MSKATQTLGFLATLAALWFALYIGLVPTSDLIRAQIVPLLPWWALVTFGAYALGSLGIDVLTFHDKPEKYKELMQQVEEAKADLTSRGVRL